MIKERVRKRERSDVYKRQALSRRTKEVVTLSGGSKRENLYVFGTINHLTDTDSLLGSMSNGTDSWNYTYDNAGNITAITSGEKRISYQYDELNQLIRENNGVLNAVSYTHLDVYKRQVWHLII